MSPQTCLVLLGFTSDYLVSLDLYEDLPGFTGFLLGLGLGLNGLYLCLSSFTEPLIGFTYFYVVIIGFHLVLLHFIRFY